MTLVVVDAAEGVARASAFELLTAARELGGDVHAVWLGEGAAAVAPTLAAYGAAVVHELPLASPEAGLPAAVAAGLAALVRETGADVVLLTAGFENRERAAHLALARDAGLVVGATGVERVAGEVVTTQQAFAATWTLRGVVTRPCAVVALSANAVRATPVDAPGTASVVVHPAIAARADGVRVVGRTPRPSSGRPDVGEAQVVVVGGRGTGGDFGPVLDLADALGGAVGATRDATDEGWIEHEAMVGQTGTSIAPRLYVGAGVSGAVHHRGGMQASGTIVAVNSDPDAPIFEIADFGVVGDLFEVLPQAAEEIRRRRG